MVDECPPRDRTRPGAWLADARQRGLQTTRATSLALIPARCHACLAPLAQAQATGSRLLCPGCHRDLPWNTPCCLRCATPLSAAGVCGSCLQHPPPYSSAFAPLRLQTPVQQWIHRLKYHADFAAAALLGGLLAEARQTTPDVLIPVPLHRWRLLRRGYNQALELARPVAAVTGITLWADVAVRTRATADQIGQTRAERRRNMRGVFVIRRPLDGLRVALIDDVMTTGATLAELARACLAAGAAEVEVWAAARTP